MSVEPKPPLRDRCHGRWRGILAELGLPKTALSGKHGPCPLCAGGGKDRFMFDDKGGNGSWICHQCGAGDGFVLAMRFLRLDFRDVAPRIETALGAAPRIEPKREPSDREKREAMARVWNEGRLIEPSSPVSRYLASRGVDVAASSESLRAGSAGVYSAMLAKVIGPDGVSVNVHRTFITSDGRKAPVETCRKLMPGTLPKGSSVRLFAHGDLLGIAEGIETAISAHVLFGIPVWAAINAGNLAGWLPPDGVREVVIFGDNDVSFTGQAAAYEAAKRIRDKGITVSVRLPPSQGTDWNDELMTSRRSAA